MISKESFENSIIRFAEDCQKRRFAAHMILHLKADIRADGHADRYSKGKTADSGRDFALRQHVTGQRHCC